MGEGGDAVSDTQCTGHPPVDAVLMAVHGCADRPAHEQVAILDAAQRDLETALGGDRDLAES